MPHGNGEKEFDNLSVCTEHLFIYMFVFVCEFACQVSGNSIIPLLSHLPTDSLVTAELVRGRHWRQNDAYKLTQTQTYT